MITLPLFNEFHSSPLLTPDPATPTQLVRLIRTSTAAHVFGPPPLPQETFDRAEEKPVTGGLDGRSHLELQRGGLLLRRCIFQSPGALRALPPNDSGLPAFGPPHGRQPVSRSPGRHLLGVIRPFFSRIQPCLPLKLTFVSEIVVRPVTERKSGSACAGALYFAGHILPFGVTSSSNGDMGQKQMGLFASVPFILYWRYTRDPNFAQRPGCAAGDEGCPHPAH